MSTSLTHRLMAVAPDDLTRSAEAVYRLLVRFCRENEDGALRWPVGTERIMRDTGYSRAAVKRARRELVARGLIEVTEQGVGRGRSRYRVVLPWLNALYEGVQVDEREAVQAGEIGSVDDPSEGSGRTHRGVTMTPPNARARRSSSAFPGVPTDIPPAAPPGPSIDPRTTHCPAAAARGRPCASCRACGTNPRSRSITAQLDASRRRMREEAERTRAQLHEAELNAVAPTPEFTAAREALRRRDQPTTAQEATA